MRRSIRGFLAGLLQQFIASWFVQSSWGQAVLSALAVTLAFLWVRFVSLPLPILATIAVLLFVIFIMLLSSMSRRRAATSTQPPRAAAQPPPAFPVIEFYDSREMLIRLRGGIHQEARDMTHGWMAWWAGSTVASIETYLQHMDRLLIYHPESETLRRFAGITGEPLEDYQADIRQATRIARRNGVEVRWSQDPITNITMDDPKKVDAFARVEVLIPCRMGKPPHAILSSYIVRRNERENLFQDLVRAYQEMWDKPSNVVPPP